MVSYNLNMTASNGATAVTPDARPLRLGPHGRVVIPAALRRALNVEPGDTLVAWLDGDRLTLRPRGAVEEELWDMIRAHGGGLADELIADRRAEARRELTERPEPR
jgi:AbrB family looped-hinge helix DNA binding protein